MRGSNRREATIYSGILRHAEISNDELFSRRVVGTARFELATPCTQNRCATRLRYVPNAPSLPMCISNEKREIPTKCNVGRLIRNGRVTWPDCHVLIKSRVLQFAILTDAKSRSQPAIYFQHSANARPTVDQGCIMRDRVFMNAGN